MSGEANRILDNFARCPGTHTTCEKPVLREIMLQTGGQLMANGQLYDIHKRSLGAGVYRLSLRPWEPSRA
jgi:hypothetical protein